MYAPETSACLETTSNDYSRADGFTAIVQPMAMRESGLGFTTIPIPLSAALETNMDPRSEARGPLSPSPTICETSARPFSDPGRSMDDILNEVFTVVFNRNSEDRY